MVGSAAPLHFSGFRISPWIFHPRYSRHFVDIKIIYCHISNGETGRSQKKMQEYGVDSFVSTIHKLRDLDLGLIPALPWSNVSLRKAKPKAILSPLAPHQIQEIPVETGFWVWCESWLTIFQSLTNPGKTLIQLMMHIHRQVLVIRCISGYSIAKHFLSSPAELKACLTSSYSSSRLQVLRDTVGISFTLGNTPVPFLPPESYYSKEHLTCFTIWNWLVQATDLSQSNINTWAVLAVIMSVLSVLEVSD